MTDLMVRFVILNIANVMIQTIKSICTIKCGKLVASLVNAIAYALYTYVIIYTICELPTWQKALIVGLANLIGVYIIKYIEEKKTKDRLWKIEFTVLSTHTSHLHSILQELNIPHNFIENVGKYTLFNIYCATKVQSNQIKRLIKKFNAKYFVSESKIL